MKMICFVIAIFILLLMSSCSKSAYSTNGEMIYKTGRNIAGEKLLNKPASRIKIVNSCKTCHGKHGDAMQNISIRYSYLSDRNNFSIPYNDSLFFRFLDKDIKADGTKANIGVTWKISDKDKKDLLDYLKKL